jgi:phage-related minor tail protein
LPEAACRAGCTPFADGGVVGGPTCFRWQGGDVGLMGEAGAEAILPLQRGPDGRLGVAAAGLRKRCR